MSEKNTVQVLIDGKIVRLSGYESEEYLEKVASYLNHKIKEFDSLKGYGRMPAEMKGTLLSLNIADDYYKARDKAESLEADLEKKDKEIYDLKQELVSLQIRMDNILKKPSGGGNPGNAGSSKRNVRR